VENLKQPKENIMGTMPVAPLLARLSLPMMASMLVQALYNVVDSVFVSQVSEAALTSVSLAFALQNVMIAVGVGTGVGVNAMLSKALGEKDSRTANLAAENGLFLAALSSVVFMGIGFFALETYFTAQSSDAVIVQGGIDYLFVCCVFSQGLFGSTMFEKVLASTGRTKYAMICQMLGAVANMILDPIFIFGYFGTFLSGTRGAAVATVIGQFIGASCGLYFCLRKTPEIHISLKELRPSGRAIARIYSVGAPSIAMQCVGSVMVFFLNRILMAFSSTAVAVFGVYFKLQSFAFMPVFGLNNGMVPIIGYNYGARRPDRVRQTIRYSALAAGTIMLIGFLLCQTIPGPMLSLFNASEQMLAIGEVALRVISWSFLLAGYSVVLCSVFQALGRGMLSLYVSVGRQIVVLIPAAWLLSRLGRVELVWWAFPIAEVMSLGLCLVFLFHIERTIIRPMAAPCPEAADSADLPE
jgi:putative MATE family efflux protein